MSDYQTFRIEYERQHKASIPVKKRTNEYPSLLVWAVLAMFLCAALLSGVHTAPTAYQTIEGSKVSEIVRQAAALATFGFVELGILVSSYLLFKRSANEYFALSVLIICSFIAMAANLYSVSKALQSDDFGSVIVGVSIGIGAPLIAALTGKVFVNLHHSNDLSEQRANEQYKQAMTLFESDILNAYREHSERLAEQVRIEQEREQRRIAAEQRKQLPAGQSKNAKKNSVTNRDHEQIRAYLMLPENQDKSIRVAAAELNAKPTLVHQIRKQINSEVQS